MRRLLLDRTGAGAAEFALILPLLTLFLFGIIDVGRYAWTWNKAEKATQMGARFAVATDPVAGGLTSFSYVGVGGLTQGDNILPGQFSTITCTNVSCTSAGGNPPVGTYSSTAFTNIVRRMQSMLPELTASQVTVTYQPSGLGYAGDPNGPDASPLVTVSISNIPFVTFSTLRVFSTSINNISATLSAEDLSGTQSN